MSEIKPLPCPFCGGVARKHRSDGDERNSYAATITYRCEDCFASRGASGDSSKGGYADNSTVEQRAIEAWNQRTESNEIAELRARVVELDGQVFAMKRGNTILIDSLMGMVDQFFRDDGNGNLSHRFMSAEEYAIKTLLEAGFAEEIDGDYRLLWDKIEEREKSLNDEVAE